MKTEEETAPLPFLYFLLTVVWSDLSNVEQTGPEIEREKQPIPYLYGS